MSWRLFQFRSLIALALFAGGAPGLSAGEDDQNLKKAREYARPRVFSIDVTSKPPKQGTAVLLKTENVGQTTFGYFATCYHVLHGAQSFKVYPSDSGAYSVTDHEKVESILARSSFDTVVFKAALSDQFAPPKPDLLANGLTPLEQDNPPRELDSLRGYVFGMFGLQKRQVFPAEVRLMEARHADLLPDVIDPTKVKDGKRLEVRFLGRELTYAGMSGGLAIDKDHKFAGLLLGRMPEPNSVPVIICAKQVMWVLDDLKMKKEAFQPSLFESDPPYKSATLQRMLENWAISDIAWNSYEAWLRVHSDKPADLLKAFQEVSLKLAELQTFARGKMHDELSVIDNTGVGAGLRIWINGTPWAPTDKPVRLQKGENLIILTRLPEAGGAGIELNDFIKPSVMDVMLNLGPANDRHAVFRLKRALPRGIRGYTIYVTILNGRPEPQDYHARLAIPLEVIESLVNHISFTMPLGENSPGKQALYRGKATVGKGAPAELRYVSPQTLDLKIEGQVHIDPFEARFAGLVLKMAERTSRVEMHGRLQFPLDRKSLLFVSARGTGAAGDNDLKLPLFGNDVTLDVSALVRALLVSYVNSHLLHPEHPKSPDRADVAKFARDLGFAPDAKGVQLIPTRVFLEQENGPQPKTWVVMTLGLFDRDRLLPVAKSPDILPDKELRRVASGDLVIRDLPLKTAAALVPALKRNAGWEAIFAQANQIKGNIDELRVTVVAPKKFDKRHEDLPDDPARLSGVLGKLAADALSASDLRGAVSFKRLELTGGQILENLRLNVEMSARGDKLNGEVTLAKGIKLWDDRTLHDLRATFEIRPDPKQPDKVLNLKLQVLGGTYTSAAQPKETKLPKQFAVSFQRDGRLKLSSFIESIFFDHKKKD